MSKALLVFPEEMKDESYLKYHNTFVEPIKEKEELVNVIGFDGKEFTVFQEWLKPADYTPPTKPECTCGAKYTSNPNWHMPGVCDLGR